jgi:hypothetical protein
MHIHTLRSLVKPIGLVVVWPTICRLYEVGFGLGKCNLVHNCVIIMLILEPPFKNTSSIVFGQPIFESLPCGC